MAWRCGSPFQIRRLKVSGKTIMVPQFKIIHCHGSEEDLMGVWVKTVLEFKLMKVAGVTMSVIGLITPACAITSQIST